jgi:diguanylate cyclase (GGDEF)-like protein
MKLLVAAADPTFRRTLATVLHGAGYDVSEVDRGAAACAALQAEGGPRIALIALDMPDLDGLEVCRRVHRSEPDWAHRSLILVAGQDVSPDVAAGFSAGAADVICMPVADDALLARVARARRVLELHDDRARSAAYLQALLAGISNGVLLSDGAGRIALANDALGEILGAPLREVVARPRKDFLAQQAEHVEPREAWLQALRAGHSERQAPLEFEVAAMPAPRIVRWSSRPVALPEGPGHVDVFRDVSLELEVQQERELMALVDPVTGLYSRRGAEDTISRELARVRRNGTKLSVALFAVVGAGPGADAAPGVDDEVLRRIGDVLSLTARMTDITARWSADELVVVLPETALESAAVFAERVCGSVRAADLSPTRTATLSVGTAEYDRSELDLDATVARAAAQKRQILSFESR